jgi:hypothetical protein
VALGLQFGVLGFALELFWGIAIDFYKIARGYELTGRAIWIVVHAAIIVSGIVVVQRARSTDSGPDISGTQP